MYTVTLSNAMGFTCTERQTEHIQLFWPLCSELARQRPRRYLIGRGACLERVVGRKHSLFGPKSVWVLVGIFDWHLDWSSGTSRRANGNQCAANQPANNPSEHISQSLSPRAADSLTRWLTGPLTGSLTDRVISFASTPASGCACFRYM